MSLLTTIPIGQYIAGTSFMHRVDPRAKLLFICFYIVLLFLANTPLSFLLAAIVCMLGVILSRIPIKYILRGLKPILWLILLTVVIQVLTNKEGALLFSWRFVEIHEKGVQEAALVSVRIILLMISASLLTLTTSPIRLTDGLESLFSPLRRFGFPAHELALMMSISLRFIPTLLEETDKIAKAQMSRGAAFSSGPIVKRMNNILPLIVPLFVQSFRRAEDLALAMEARGYRGGVGRTKYRQLQFSWRDIVLLITAVILAVIVWFLRA
ncbi:energy-coupling factor transporter transmembrane component T family protein [Aneurinibacillus tyrosinisolvens]|uniref:energy-coupling factor transporter transmembrane component T family protein n=1 Tax=Aneurinibacillus tyrosinisolvens TaxID=1443435 RepID=UPI00063FCE88|nr:energy-coupling factor transporter transmembrane component T [Aneurinibacillus tyrosinisolvens]